MANFYQVFKNESICKYATAYCEYDGDVEVICGKCRHGKLFCYKCSDYKPRNKEANNAAVEEQKDGDWNG